MKGYGPASKGKNGAATRSSSGPYSKIVPVAGKAVRPTPSGLPSGGKGLDDEARMVYVANLPFSVEWQELKDLMKQAGEVEYAKILSLDGSLNGTRGNSRGKGYVKFMTAEEAQNAVAMLNGTEIDGREIVVDAWTGGSGRKEGGSPRSSSVGKGKGGFVGEMFAAAPWRGAGGSFGKNGGKTGKKSQARAPVHGEASHMVWVGNLPHRAQWQQLKDLMKEAGSVEFVKTLHHRDTGRPRGTALVRFSTEEEAQHAIETLNGSSFMGREITVDVWTEGEAGDEK